MIKKLPSYEDCLNLCSNNSPFYEIKTTLLGYDVSLFNYRLADYKDFNRDFAKEMRGICFVFNTDGTVYNRYLLLDKFFNLNQVDETQYSIIKDRVVKSIYNKEDGSVISFIKLPNGDIIAKSKMSFISDQSIRANKIYKECSKIKIFVNWCISNDIIPIFEYVSIFNRIVLKYDKEELILLRLRRNSTGEYLNLHDYSDVIGDLKTADSFDLSLDELVELAKTVEGVEGWVVDLDGLFVKIKTVWYCERHGLLTEDLYRENILVKYILDDKIDDVLGQIPEDEKEAHARIEKIIAAVSKAVKMKVDSILEDWKVFQTMADGKDWTGDLKDQLMRKSYAMKYKKTKNFGAVMLMAKGNDVYDIVTEQIAKETFRLQNARAFLFEIDSTLNFKDEKIENED